MICISYKIDISLNMTDKEKNLSFSDVLIVFFTTRNIDIKTLNKTPLENS